MDGPLFARPSIQCIATFSHCSHYRVFPVCITILSCSVNRVSSALLRFLTAHITGFYLFCKQFFPVQFIDFPCYYKNSDLHEIPCSYSHFFLLRLQGIPCLYYTFLMLILIFTPFHHYIIFPVIATQNSNVSITLVSISPLHAFPCDNDILQGNSFNDCIKVSVMKSNDIQ